MKNLLVILSLALFASCQSGEGNVDAQKIVDKAIMTACDGHCDTAEIEFTFRDKLYRSKRDNGTYALSRVVKNDKIDIEDVVTNDGFNRLMRGTAVAIKDTVMIAKLADAVNSVHYFAQLPYGLNEPAVVKELLGEAVIKNEPYFEIGVTFNQEGGGTDFEDEFVYWIHKENYTVDYLAYSYATNGGGIRFREAINPRTVGGIRFVDYNNFKPATLETPLTDLDTAFEAGKLKLLSKIELENVSVK